MTDPKVSIIIPVYNVEKYIEQCLDSIINGTYKNIEIIVVNDGSSDNTEKIIKEKYLTKIKYISKKNNGVAEARNVGIDNSTGDFLVFVDGDDWISSDCISNAVDCVCKTEADIVLGGTVFVYKDKNECHIPLDTQKEWVITDKINEYKKCVLGNMSCAEIGLVNCFTSGPVCKLIKKSALGDSIRFKKDLITGEDTVFNVQMLSNVKKVVLIPQKWYFYRMNQYSVTKAYTNDISDYTKKLLVELLKYVDNEELKKAYEMRAVQQFYGILLLNPVHPDCPLKYKQRLNYIRDLLDDDFWKTFYNNINVFKGSILDTKLVNLCKKHKYISIYFFVKLRKTLKKIRMRMK